MSACERTWFSKEQPMTCERFSISCRKTLQVDLPSTNGLGGRNEITLSIKRNSLPKRRRLKKMQTEVRTEQPLIILEGGSGYSDEGENLPITARMLREAEVGKVFRSYMGNVIRDSVEESLEIVYKTPKGVAGLLRTYGHTDSPSQNNGYENEPVLIWFELS